MIATDLTAGPFRIDVASDAIAVRHLHDPAHEVARILRVAAAVADAQISEERGAFQIRDRVVAESTGWALRAATPTTDGGVRIDGVLTGGVACAVTVTLRAGSDLGLGLEIRTDAATVNRIRLQLASHRDERFYGCGHQMTYFDLKGTRLPLLSQEQGIGRGLPVVSQFMDLVSPGSAGDTTTTYCAIPAWTTSERRGLILDNLEYAVLDLTSADVVDLWLHAPTLTGRILAGRTPLELLRGLTEVTGRMRALPDWMHDGVIVGLQGGTARALRALDELDADGTPVAALWMQDWVGQRPTVVGEQLWWDWELDPSQYPDWDRLVDRLEAAGRRALVYINPYLANAPGRNRQFSEAKANGYLVRRADGAPYMIKNTDFDAGIVDLSNPAARDWLKGIITNELLGRARSCGWMADFAEGLPFDCVLHDGDPAQWHNRYPVEWAKLCREVIDAVGRDDVVVFHRSGHTRSPEYAPLMWLGDQLVTWDIYDGMRSALTGLLTGGMSGFPLLHSDVGGYTNIGFHLRFGPVDIPFRFVKRSSELLMRWMELNAFSPVFRTHEGIDPGANSQWDTDAQTRAHLRRCARMYVAWAPLRRRLVAEAARSGAPVVRPLYLHFPDDPAVARLDTEFLLGEHVLVAPVLDPEARSVDVYLPAGSWTDVWTGARHNASHARTEHIPAPLGRPALFVRTGSPEAEELIPAFANI